jgi:uncharacterized protein
MRHYYTSVSIVEDLRRRLDAEGSLTLTVRAKPNARVTEVSGVLEDGSVKIAVHAAPEDGVANEEIVRYLAEAFGVSRKQVELLSGHRGRLKIVRITRV